jgi:hypothetical protein
MNLSDPLMLPDELLKLEEYLFYGVSRLISTIKRTTNTSSHILQYTNNSLICSVGK